MHLHRDEALAHWPAVRAWVADACEHGDGWWSPEAAEHLLERGLGVLWVLMDGGKPVAGIVTAIARAEHHTSAEIVLAGGSGVLASLASEWPKLETWAREQGAREMLVRGRRGWAKALSGVGCTEIAVTLRKGL